MVRLSYIMCCTEYVPYSTLRLSRTTLSSSCKHYLYSTISGQIFHRYPDLCRTCNLAKFSRKLVCSSCTFHYSGIRTPQQYNWLLVGASWSPSPIRLLVRTIVSRSFHNCVVLTDVWYLLPTHHRSVLKDAFLLEWSPVLHPIISESVVVF